MKKLVWVVLLASCQAAAGDGWHWGIVDKSDGEQIRASITEGMPFDYNGTLLWDEKRDGPIPGNVGPIGGLVKCGATLCESSDRLAQHQAALAADAARRAAEYTLNQELKARREQLAAALAAFDAAIDSWPSADAAAVKAQVLRNAKALRYLIKKELRK
jgi:hypothetical protein